MPVSEPSSVNRTRVACIWCRTPYDDVGERCMCRPAKSVTVPWPTRAELEAEVERLREQVENERAAWTRLRNREEGLREALRAVEAQRGDVAMSRQIARAALNAS